MATVREGNKAVLLVVDVQVDVMRQSWDAARVTRNVVLAVERAHARGAPVLWVQHEDDHMPHGSPAWQWVPELVPPPGAPRIFKKYNSSFEDTPLEQELAQLGATHIVLCGAMTNWCIRATAFAALERGYDVTLVADAHTTAPIERDDGSVITAKDIVDELNVGMTWVDYPGRKSRAMKVEELAFG